MNEKSKLSSLISSKYRIDSFSKKAKESQEMIKDLKETLSETKETIHEHVAVIGTQRAEIDSLRNLLDQNEIEVNFQFASFFFILKEFGGKSSKKHASSWIQIFEDSQTS